MDGGASTRTGRLLLVAVAACLVLAGVVIAFTVRRFSPEPAVTAAVAADAPVQVRASIEAIDATRGTASIRLVAEPGTADLPAGGITVLTDVEGAAPLTVRRGDLGVTVEEGVMAFDEGSVSAYPFDTYAGGFAMLAVRGEPESFDDVELDQVVPLTVTVVDLASGFDLDATGSTDGMGGIPIVELHVTADRSRPVVVWASTMMAIYWLLAAAVVAVVAAVLSGYREWETRHLAWLAAMIFAFSSFRAAAPGSPPIGVFFDYASFFWAVLLVAVALAALVANFLVGSNIAGLEGPRATARSEGDEPPPGTEPSP